MTGRGRSRTTTGCRSRAAYDHADRAIALGRIAGPTVYVAHYLNTKAECAAKLGDWDTADRVAREALDLASAGGAYGNLWLLPFDPSGWIKNAPDQTSCSPASVVPSNL